MKSIFRYTLTTLLVLLTALPAYAAEKITYYHNDALGSPVAATNQLGQVIWRETYKPHGQRTTNATVSANNKVWFTGKQEESALGISYFGARWYHPEVGRFLVIDPAGVSPDNMHSFNRYAYANNNPYTHVDPSGGVVETVWDVFNTGLGVASFANNIQQGNYGAAALDGVGVAVDGAAAIAPFIPGGVGAAIKAGRAADDVVDAAKGAKAFSKEKQALVEMAKADKKTGMTSGDMQAYKDLNKQLPDPFPTNRVRGPESHSSGAPSSQQSHGHVGPVNHIPIRDVKPKQ